MLKRGQLKFVINGKTEQKWWVLVRSLEEKTQHGNFSNLQKFDLISSEIPYFRRFEVAC